MKQNQTTKNTNTIVLPAILAILVIAIAVLPSAHAAPAVTVSLSKYDPYPATPGQIVKVWLLVQNTGDSSAKDISVEMIPQYPFTLYGSDAVQKVSLLGPRNDYLIDYTLKVDDNAVQGNNVIRVKFSEGSVTSVQQTVDLNIFIQSKDATVSIDSIRTEPAELTPGGDGTITFTVKNNAPTALTDLSLKLYLQSVIGGALVDLPFAPMDSTAEKRIYRLDAGQSANFTYAIKAYPDAVSKVYKIPFVLTYYDTLGNQKNKSDLIGVVINSRPEVEMIIDKTDLSQQKRAGTITLKTINKGLADVKFLNIILQKSKDYDILSTSDTVYIGNLVSDDYQTTDFKLLVTSKENSVTIPVTVQYRDANNKYYEETKQINLNLVDSSKLSEADKQGGSSVALIVVVIIIVAIGIWIYMRQRKKKNKKAQFN